MAKINMEPAYKDANDRENAFIFHVLGRISAQGTANKE